MMEDKGKTEEELVTELAEMRQRIAELEASETKRKRAEEALQEEKNKLQAVVDAMEYGLTIQDREYNITYQNQLLQDIFGRLGEKCYRVYEGRDEICDGCPVEMAWANGQPHTSERKVVMPSGETAFWENTANPIRNARGEMVACLEIARNITERKQAEEALRQSVREAAIRNQIAQIFLTIPDEEMYGEALLIIMEALESEYGVFGYTDEDGALVVPSMTREVFWQMCNVPEKDIVFPRDTWGTSTWCEAIKKKRWFYSNEPSKVPEGHIPISRHISMPIVYQDESIGLLQVANRETDYDEQDIQLLHSIAEYMAPVLNARLQRDRQEEARKRTEEALAQQVEELESFHRLAVGRELRMIELKRQVNELSEQLGREAPYDLSLLE